MPAVNATCIQAWRSLIRLFQGRTSSKSIVHDDEHLIKEGDVPPQDVVFEDKFPHKGRFISGGSSSLIRLRPSGTTVLKNVNPYDTDPESRVLIETEFEIYKRLGSHPRLVRMYDYTEEDGLELEYMPNGCLWDYYQKKAETITNHQRRQWILDACEGIQLLHSHRIIHQDIKMRNFMLDSKQRLCVIDFAGSSIDGADGGMVENTRYFQPRDFSLPRIIGLDIFALGSLIYEITTGQEPYADVPDKEVESLYAAGRFPCTDSLPFGRVMQKCSRQEFKSVNDILLFLTTEDNAT